jgi:hypothetical protein
MGIVTCHGIIILCLTQYMLFSRFVYQAQLGHQHPSVQSPPQLPPKIRQQPILPPKIPINRDYDLRLPDLPPKIKLHDDKEVYRSGPTTDGKRK